MTWDFAEGNPFSEGTGNWLNAIDWVGSAIRSLPTAVGGTVRQLDATRAVDGIHQPAVSTDPPYYDNIGYADLSDFFYVWLRRSVGTMYPDLFSTLFTPKNEELVATPYRFGGSKEKAKEFFEGGLRESFVRMYQVHDSRVPLTLFYAFKQTGSDDVDSHAVSTGWETMLEGLLAGGFSITGTWPVRSERSGRTISVGTNALASSIVLVCRPRPATAPVATRREFLLALKDELPGALRLLQRGNIAPVDLAQAAIGPGMAVFSRYAKVVEASGERMAVRAALGLINQMLDEVLTEQDADFDGATRFAIAWFESHGLGKGPYGEAQVLAQAKGTTPEAIQREGFLRAAGGKVQLLDWKELPAGWDPSTDKRLTYWEATHYLIRAHQDESVGSERAASELLRRMPGYGETARELAYRLHRTCEAKKWTDLAISYNALVVAWPEITRLADAQAQAPEQASFGG